MTNKFIKPFDEHKREQQKFDIKKTYFIRKGKKINVYDFIQSNREDTEIIPTLRKYGNLKPMEVDYEGMYETFTEKIGLREVLDLNRKAEEMFDSLPAEIKVQFNNDKYEFAEKGQAWLNEKIKTIQPTTPTTNNTTDPEGVNNVEQK